MAPLSAEQVLRDNNGGDFSSVTALNLSLRALSDVNFLSAFQNLGRLDLSCNGLTSVEGLRSCVNLKWLSVTQNKLKSLRGIEGLFKLTVLNASKNMLLSMEEVKSLTELRALVLNDNEISSICNLGHLQYLNTLVLSQNPVHDIGSSLKNSNNLIKLSLSKCKIEAIGSSFVFSLNLKELRLCDNEIVSLPEELARNNKLQTVDLGKNLITRLSDIKVLSQLHNLKNLNLQGNPVVENPKLFKKIRKLVPNLQIFNAKPIERWNGGKMLPEKDVSSPLKRDRPAEDAIASEGREKVKKTKKLKMASHLTEKVIASINEDAKFSVTVDDAKGMVESKLRKGQSKPVDFDDGETSFLDLINSEDAPKNPAIERFGSVQPAWDEKLLGGVVLDHRKKIKTKKSRKGQSVHPGSKRVPDFGDGGPSIWG